MRRGIRTVAAVAVLATGGVTACASGVEQVEAEKPPKIGVILPESSPSIRWERADRTLLAAAFTAAGVDHDIQHADTTAFPGIAEEMLADGVTVLMVVSPDADTGQAVLAKARSQGVATIDYDRLTRGGTADYHVGFDHEAVGRLQGAGLVECLTDQGVRKPVVAYLNGDATDHDAALLRTGYDSVLGPKFDDGEYRKGPERSVPEAEKSRAATVVAQMLTETRGGIDAVLAADDSLAHATVSALRKERIAGTVPVTGQDASVQGLRNILAGDQCMTVYRSVRQQAEAAAKLATTLARGEWMETSATVKDPENGREVPAVLLTPKAIHQAQVKDVVADGFVTSRQLCTGEYAALCAEAGIR